MKIRFNLHERYYRLFTNIRRTFSPFERNIETFEKFKNHFVFNEKSFRISQYKNIKSSRFQIKVEYRKKKNENYQEFSLSTNPEKIENEFEIFRIL